MDEPSQSKMVRIWSAAVVTTLLLPIAVWGAERGESTGVVAEAGHLSLPNLLTINDPSELDLNWERYDNIRLDTGRLLIGAGGGALWLSAGLANSADEWTVELVVRSTGTSERDLEFHDTNSVSLWFTADKITSGVVAATAQYDGIQVVLLNRGSKGLKVFLNDGVLYVEGDVANSVGLCDFNYLDLGIPFTVRVSYSRDGVGEGAWFKVQVDNNLCFRTDTIAVPPAMGDLRFGVTASVASRSLEEFEILKLDVWNHLTADALDDHGLMGDGVVVEEKSHVPPAAIRQLLMERTRQAREAMQQQPQSEAPASGSAPASGPVPLELLLQLDAISRQIDAWGGGQRESLAQVQHDIDTFKTTLSQQFAQLLSAVSKLNERVIGEVREQQHGMDDLARKVDLLMANHKEVAYQYQRDTERPQEDIFDRFVARIKWFLIPLCVGVMVLTGFIYRLRHDIKHSKLL